MHTRFWARKTFSGCLIIVRQPENIKRGTKWTNISPCSNNTPTLTDRAGRKEYWRFSLVQIGIACALAVWLVAKFPVQLDGVNSLRDLH
nr:hypothetical protein [uncultured Kingella sp.]